MLRHDTTRLTLRPARRLPCPPGGGSIPGLRVASCKGIVMAFQVFKSDWSGVYGVRRPSDGESVATFVVDAHNNVQCIEFTDPRFRKANRTRHAVCDAVEAFASSRGLGVTNA